MNTPFMKVALAIAAKDFRSEIRSRELIGAMLMFTLLAILIFSFALELDREAREEAVSGVLWVTIVFGSILGLNRSLAIEREGGNMDAMLLSPVDRAAIYTGKAIGNFVFTLAVGLLLLPLMAVLFNTDTTNAWIIVIMVLGVLGFSSVGTLLAAMTVQTRAREALLPIAMLPVALPLLLATVRASTAILSGVAFDEWSGWTQIIIVIDLVYIIICLLTFAYVVEE